MEDDTIRWLQDTASANNASTSSVDYAKIEEGRRRQYKKIEQMNLIYRSAKELGFPEKVIETTKQGPYYVIVSVPRCFDSRYYPGKDVGNPCFFYRLKIDSFDAASIYDGILGEMEEIPSFVLWLLVCMKLFYKKDWDGKKWIDENEGFKDDGTSTYSEFSEVSEIHEEVVAKLAEQMAIEVDREIMKAIQKDPNEWHVQVGNVIYTPKGKIYEGI